MGNKVEELRLSKLMPAVFRDACPCCGVTWHFDAIEHRTAIKCKQGCFSFCQTQAFVESQIETAWQKLWRSFVQSFGLREAIRLCDSRLLAAAELCGSISEELFADLVNSVDKARDLFSKSAGEMVPSVFMVADLGGGVKFGVNFQHQETKVGSRFHYDHGAGVTKNSDAEVLWIYPSR